MERETCREIVRGSLEPMARAMWLGDWQIQMIYRDLEGQIAGTCEANPRYRTATIELDPCAFEKPAKLLEVLRHELLHVCHARFESYRRQVERHVEGPGLDALNECFKDAIEELVGNLERLLDFNGITPDALIERGRKHLGLDKKKRQRAK